MDDGRNMVGNVCCVVDGCMMDDRCMENGYTDDGLWKVHVYTTKDVWMDGGLIYDG